MRGIEFYDRLLDVPGPSAIAQLFYAGVFLVIVSVTLLSLDRFRYFARGLGIAGVVCFMLALFLIHEQKVTERKDEHVTVTHWRYPPAVRFQVRVALLGLPAAAAFLMAQGYWSTQRWQRSKVPALIKDGRLRLIKGDLDGAQADLDAALKISPYLGDGYFHRAAIYEAQGRQEDAIADLDQALRCDPQIAAAYLARGRLLIRRGDLQAAGADLDRYLAMRPSDVEGYLHRGLCRARENRDVEAVADLQRVLKMTNHSDYADPAHEALKALYDRVPSAEETEALPPPDDVARSVLDALPHYDEHVGRATERGQEEVASNLPSARPAAAAPTPNNTLPPR